MQTDSDLQIATLSDRINQAFAKLSVELDRARTELLSAVENVISEDERSTVFLVEAVTDLNSDLNAGEEISSLKELAKRLGVTPFAVQKARKKYAADFDSGDRSRASLINPNIGLERGSFIIRGVQLIAVEDIKD